MNSDSASKNLFEKVRPVIAAALNSPEDSITERTRADDVANWDSLHQLALVLAIENAFGLRVSGRDVASLNSVEAILEFLQGRLPKGHA